ncbi:hypothetical protein Dimus_026014 [Dionaea muscipula]
MECIEARALKSSCFSQLAMKSSSFNHYPQVFPDDLWCFAAGTNGVLPISDDFSVDEFFDLPNEGEGGELMDEDEEEDEKGSSTLSLSSLDQLDDGRSNSSSAVSASLSGQDLSFQVDDMEELELWSHLMDDSAAEASLAYPILETELHGSNQVEPDKKPISYRIPCIPVAFPVRPRSKLPRRSRFQVRSCGSTASTTESSPAAEMGGVMFMNPVRDWESLLCFTDRAQKKRKKTTAAATGGEEQAGGGGTAVQRRCTHCQVEKTPQWRAGPLGPKTLCNACGVRFKKGRLYPEYRPACSPTFSRGIHSNSHRKVLEMRKRKGATAVVEDETRPDVVASAC